MNELHKKMREDLKNNAHCGNCKWWDWDSDKDECLDYPGQGVCGSPHFEPGRRSIEIYYCTDWKAGNPPRGVEKK